MEKTSHIVIIYIISFILGVGIGFGFLVIKSEAPMLLLKSSSQFNDKTYEDLRLFIEKDSTNNNIYDILTYNCVDFSVDFLSNARDSGFSGIYVILVWDDQSAHRFVAIYTIDRGIVYIEPQSDEEYIVTGNIEDMADLCTNTFCWGKPILNIIYETQ